MKKVPSIKTKSTQESHKANTHQEVKHSETLDSSVDTTIASSLTATDVSTLLYMIEEEKMARDIYDTLFEQTGLTTFDKISNSEQKHYDSLLSTALKLGVDTSALSTEAGIFSNDTIQSLYDQLVLQATISTDDAIAVGITIEQTDIADLQATIETTDIILLGHMYSNLLNGTQHHLTAFENIA